MVIGPLRIAFFKRKRAPRVRAAVRQPRWSVMGLRLGLLPSCLHRCPNRSGVSQPAQTGQPGKGRLSGRLVFTIRGTQPYRNNRWWHAIRVDHLYARLSTPPSFLRRPGVRHDQRASPVGTASHEGPGRSVVNPGHCRRRRVHRHRSWTEQVAKHCQPRPVLSPPTPQLAGSHGVALV